MFILFVDNFNSHFLIGNPISAQKYFGETAFTDQLVQHIFFIEVGLNNITEEFFGHGW